MKNRIKNLYFKSLIIAVACIGIVVTVAGVPDITHPY
jgi:hypothetical protein